MNVKLLIIKLKWVIATRLEQLFYSYQEMEMESFDRTQWWNRNDKISLTQKQ